MNAVNILSLEARTQESERLIMDRAIARDHEVLSRINKIRAYAALRDDLAMEYNSLIKERGVLARVIQHAQFSLEASANEV
jgi:hypothetical protein